MPNTYVALDQVTVSGTSTTTVNFTNIPLGYTDLVIVVNCGISNSDYLNLRAGNGSVNTGSIYSQTVVEGNGSSASSSRGGSRTAFWPSWTTTLMPTSVTANYIINIMNYSNTTTNKTFLSRGNIASAGVDAIVCNWNSTVAINTISLFPNSQDGRYFLAGSTFSLYGIANANQGGPKATGGTIGEDSQYWYHTFGASGAFVPNQSLTCDVLVVAGGGGGGYYYGAGGGGGGVQYATSQSLSATTYNVTIGSGGPSRSGSSAGPGTVGVDSSFSSLVIAKGGGFGNGAVSGAANGGNGGSGGGAGGPGSGTGGTAVPGTGGTFYGSAGGSGLGGNSGGGAGQAGASQSKGGNGTALFSSWGMATGTGHNVVGAIYYAGGGEANGSFGGGGFGGGGAWLNSGAVNTGGGAGADQNGGAGGSGIVIVRYAK